MSFCDARCTDRYFAHAAFTQDDFYSPLWSVNVYDNMDFDMVNNLSSAGMANILATGVATVNCPVVFME